MRIRLLLLISLSSLVFPSCSSREVLKDRGGALRPTTFSQTFSDDLEIGPLVEAMEKQVALFEGSPAYPHPLVFGSRIYAPTEYARGLRAFMQVAKTKPRHEALAWLKRWFDVYEVYGTKDWSEVFLTSYFEPVLEGSRVRTARFSSPLLLRPPDLVDVDLEKFGNRFQSIRQMRGRIEKDADGRMRLVPFPDRKEIETEKALKKQKLEIAWVDPIDGFLLQIQGSGTVILEGGKELRLGYDGQNGHPYESIGKFVGAIPLSELNLITLEAHLRSLSSNDLHKILNQNPSYVFFRHLDGKPLTYIRSEVVAGRTIATDTRYFPKGALAYLSFPKPQFKGPYLQAPAGWERTSRLVLDQDTGGAIRGGGRVDLFWGRGPEAKLNASVVKHPAQLYYLAPKQELLARLSRGPVVGSLRK